LEVSRFEEAAFAGPKKRRRIPQRALYIRNRIPEQFQETPGAGTMSKDIYYSDKYYDEQFEYRLVVPW